MKNTSGPHNEQKTHPRGDNTRPTNKKKFPPTTFRFINESVPVNDVFQKGPRLNGRMQTPSQHEGTKGPSATAPGQGKVGNHRQVKDQWWWPDAHRKKLQETDTLWNIGRFSFLFETESCVIHHKVLVAALRAPESLPRIGESMHVVGAPLHPLDS